jgi:phosphoenolpyruvate---glycerone phosphotransferase subunit DhaL
MKHRIGENVKEKQATAPTRAISTRHIRRWLLLYAHRIAEQKSYLTELDAAIGDGDHGINMERGMARVRQRLESTRAAASTDGDMADGDMKEGDIGALLRNVAMILISSVGGAAGPLYGAFFLWAAKSVGSAHSVTPAQLAAMFRMGLEGVEQRGKAHPGEKTMIDALAPAILALEEAAAQDMDLDTGLAQAVAAAEAGMNHTIELQALKGRASYLGPRSIGHMDPGAASVFLLIRAAAETLGSSELEPTAAPPKTVSHPDDKVIG